MIASILVLAAFLFSFIAAVRLLSISWRTATISLTLSATFGLSIFSALTTIPQLSIQRISELPPEIEITVAPLILLTELLAGTYLTSKILNQNFLRLLKLTLLTFSLTAVISIPLLLLAL